MIALRPWLLLVGGLLLGSGVGPAWGQETAPQDVIPGTLEDESSASETSAASAARERRDAFFTASGANGLSRNDARPAYGPPRSLALQPLIDPQAQARADTRDSAPPPDDAASGAAVQGGNEAMGDSLIPTPIQAAELSDWDVASAGVLTAEAGGLAADLWVATRLDEALQALAAMPVDAPSPTLQSLIRRLLLTAAPPPADAAGRGWDFIAARLEKLLQAGDLEGLADMLDALPHGQGPTRLSPLKADVWLLAGDIASACQEARRAVETEQTLYWMELLIACRAMEGDQAGARLTLDGLEERHRVNPFYRRLIAAIGQQASASTAPAPLAPLEWPADVAPTPLLIALAQAAGVALPAAPMAKASPLLRAAVALSPALRPSARLAGAEAATNRGLFSPDRFLSLVLATRIASDGASGPVLPPGLKSRASALQAAAKAVEPAMRAQILTELWRQADEDGVFPAWALASQDLAAAIEPAPSLLASAPALARGLALAGKAARVADWYRLARGLTGAEVDEASPVLLEIWPLALVLDESGLVPFSPRILDLWWQSQADLAPAARASRAVGFFTILEALDHPLPAEAWSVLAGLGPELNLSAAGGAAWDALVAASASRKPGLTIAYAAAALGAADGLNTDSNALREALLGLRRIGLAEDARRLAAEALILRGF
jgi:hypothetical protein